MTALVLMPLAEQRGGAELTLLHLLQHGRGAGVRWCVIFFENGPMVQRVASLGIDAHVIPAGRLRQPVRVLQTIRAIARAARKIEADFIFSWMPKAHLYGGIAARWAGIPCGWFQHQLATQSSRLDRTISAVPARLILTCAQNTADAQASLSPNRPIHVVHPGAELDRFNADALPTPAECRATLRLPDDGPVIGIVGRLQRWKGMHTLVHAMPGILQRHPHARAVIVGGKHNLEPDYGDWLKELVQARGLSQRVHLPGHQSNIHLWMQAMDIVVHASDSEPFGIVVVEAMALGKPVIAGDSGGPPEIITPHVDGLLTPYEDAAALADAVNGYLDHPEQMRQMGRAAAKRAADFSDRAFAQKVLNRLELLVDQPETEVSLGAA